MTIQQPERIRSKDNPELLLIEDNLADVELFRIYLAQSKHKEFRLSHASDLSTGLAMLEKFDYTLVLLDLSLTDSRGPETWRAVLEKAPNIPLIILTGSKDLELAVQALGEEVQDYLYKEELSTETLERSIRYAIERKRSILKLKQAESHHKILAQFPEHHPNPIFRVTENLRILYANPSSQTLLASWKTQVNGLLPEIWRPLLEEQNHTQQTSNNFFEINNRTFSFTIYKLPEEKQFYIFGDDITQYRTTIKKLENTIEEKNKLEKESEAKSTFLANMSHELRTPLNVILGYSKLILEELEFGLDKEKVRQDLNHVIDSSFHLTSMIGKILDLSKIEAGKVDVQLQELKLEPFLEKIEAFASSLNPENQNSFEIQQNLFGNIITDETKICQILYNLLGNASKFTENGKLTLIVNKVHEEQQTWVEWIVEDTGVGIPTKELPRMLQPFEQQTSADSIKGTGLGLSITNKLCLLMGGTLTLKNKAEGGLHCQIRLPLLDEIT